MNDIEKHYHKEFIPWFNHITAKGYQLERVRGRCTTGQWCDYTQDEGKCRVTLTVTGGTFTAEITIPMHGLSYDLDQDWEAAQQLGTGGWEVMNQLKKILEHAIIIKEMKRIGRPK
jgi:hypothetical protein